MISECHKASECAVPLFGLFLMRNDKEGGIGVAEFVIFHFGILSFFVVFVGMHWNLEQRLLCHLYGVPMVLLLKGLWDFVLI